MVRAGVAMAAVTLALVSCGESGREPSGSPATSEATSAATPSGTPSETPARLACVPGAEPFTGPAADELGADRVMAAYCMLADLADEQERTSLALPVPEQDAADLRPLRRMLTARALERWDDRADVDGLTLHDLRRVPRGYQRADDGPYVFGTTVGPATAALDGDALRLTFVLETGLVLEERGDDTGRHSLLPVTRTGTYVLVPEDGRWLVDDWDVTFEHGPVRLVSG
ncbi:hypothetical protein GCM10023339_08460 [Alloalcanivorax gelatiniphagus]